VTDSEVELVEAAVDGADWARIATPPPITSFKPLPTTHGSDAAPTVPSAAPPLLVCCG